MVVGSGFLVFDVLQRYLVQPSASFLLNKTGFGRDTNLILSSGRQNNLDFSDLDRDAPIVIAALHQFRHAIISLEALDEVFHFVRFSDRQKERPYS